MGEDGGYGAKEAAAGQGVTVSRYGVGFGSGYGVRTDTWPVDGICARRPERDAGGSGMVAGSVGWAGLPTVVIVQLRLIMLIILLNQVISGQYKESENEGLQSIVGQTLFYLFELTGRGLGLLVLLGGKEITVSR